MDQRLGENGHGVSPISIDDRYINSLILAACKLNCLSPTLINHYIPNKAGTRNTFAFQCLLNIKVTPRLTKTAYATYYNTSKQSTCHAIAYLKDLGLVSELGKPRLIIPFQKFKVDKTYVLTPKGSKVVTALLTIAEII